MRNTKQSGGFFPCLLLNIFIHWEGLLPAVVLLVLHFCLGWSIWWAALALGIWILGVLLRMLIIGWAGKCSAPEPPKENKNPYSFKNTLK